MNELADALRQAVVALDFPTTADRWQGRQPMVLMPAIDLAVVRFAPGARPVWANVLFSRERPRGLVAEIGSDAGAVRNLRYDADVQDAKGDSAAWLPGADWSRLSWVPVVPNATATERFVAPYPASLLKLMVAVGVGLAVDAGRCAWPAALAPMITASDNDATDACVALLHRTGVIGELARRFAALGLHTLQLNDTTPAGGWRNGDGSGVGHIHMTAWDTARLLWLLDGEAPPAPWLPPGTQLLQPATREHLRGLLAAQQHDEILSSGSLRGVPGWVAGLPDAPAFAHKTGTTDNYASDAGIVRTPHCHYLVAVLTSVGLRYAAPDPPQERCATTWRLPALGAAVHALMASLP
jgi:hypothetical protein